MCNFDDLEKRICSKVLNNPSRRFIAYALDLACLSDEAYQDFPQFISQQEGDAFSPLRRYPYITRLFWIRTFFENGDGQNFKMVFCARFADKLNLYDQYRLTQLASQLPAPFASRQEFLMHCWLLSGENLGQSSEMWRYLRLLVNRVPVNTSHDQVADILQELGECNTLPSYYDRLIDLRDQDFVSSIYALRNAQGDGWLSRIAPLWGTHANKCSATVEWKLNINGNRAMPVLAVENIFIPNGQSGNLVLSQDNVRIEIDLNGRDCMVFLPEELKNANIDVTRRLVVGIGITKLVDVEPLNSVFHDNGPSVFRYPEKCYLLPNVDASEATHIFAKRLAIVWPSGINVRQIMLHGDHQVTIQRDGNLMMPLGPNRLFQIIELNGLAGQSPKPLQWNNQTLLTIGSKPFLQVNGQDEQICWLEEDSIPVVTGIRADVVLKNWPAGQPVPLVTIDDIPQVSLNGIFAVTGQYGDIKTIRIGDVKTKILFVPDFADQLSGWSWLSDVDGSSIASWAKEGLETGYFGDNIGHCFKMSRPLENIVRWWQHVATNNPEFVDEIKEFNDHAEMSAFRLHVWVPEGQPQPVRFGPVGLQVCLRELNGGMHHSIRLGELLSGHGIAEGVCEIIDELMVGDLLVAKVFRVPIAPVLVIHNGQPQVFFPQAYIPDDYSLICLYESGIKDNKIEVLPCQGMQCLTLNHINFNHLRIDQEGVWVALMHPAVPLTASLIDISSLYAGPEHVLQWYRPGDIALATRLQVEAGSLGANNVRGLLDFLGHAVNNLQQNGVFTEAISNRELLNYSNKPEYWSQYFADHCQIEAPVRQPVRGRRAGNAPRPVPYPAPLKTTLELMLKAGFNWCAEPDWYIGAHQAVKNKYRHWTENRKALLNDLCPMIAAQLKIESGEAPAGVRNGGGFHHGLLRPPQHMWVIKCPESDVPAFQNGISIWRGAQDSISPLGIWLQDFSSIRPVRFVYHGVNTLRDTCGAHCKFRCCVGLNRDNDYVEFVLDENSVGDNMLLSGEDMENLNQVFNAAIVSARGVVGALNDRGLGHMFTQASHGFQEWAQPARVVIFQAAVLSRLHAWLGWRRNPENSLPAYPNDWPMNNPETYDRVCRVVCAAWLAEDFKKVLIKDLIPVEWMLAWFHN